MNDFLHMDQGLSRILVRYAEILQKENVQIPVEPIVNAVNNILMGTEQFAQYCKEGAKDSVVFALNRLVGDINANRREETIKDLYGLVFNMKTYLQLMDYMKLAFEETARKETITTHRFLKLYADSDNEEFRKMAERVRAKDQTEIFNYDFADKYTQAGIFVYFDEECGLFYTIYKGKRMYMSSTFRTEKEAKAYLVTLFQEQDEESPHCYQNDGFEVKEGMTVIDAGVAEGNFALDVIDKVDKIYLVECDADWIEALKHTFAPYMDKVVFVEKYLSDKDDEENASIDGIIGDGKVDYIKMDIEGFEVAALEGAAKILGRGDDLVCNICSYHKSGDEEKISEILEAAGLKVSTSRGYLFFKWDTDTLADMELRRALTRGIRKKGGNE